MAARNLVRVDHVLFDERVGDIVRPRRQVRAVEKRIGFERPRRRCRR
jgi:hypothetical protein